MLGGLAGASITSLIISAGLQPIEKQIVMDQLLQSPSRAANTGTKAASKNALAQIKSYVQHNGVRALYQGFSALFVRELIYIASVTVLTPLCTDYWLRRRALHKEAPRADSNRFDACPDGGPAAEGQPILTLEGFASGFSIGFSAGMISAPCQTVNAMMKDERNRYVQSRQAIVITLAML